MKHLILVKWKKEYNKVELLHGAEDAFKDATSIEGCRSVKVYPCCIDRENRFDVMIELDIDKDCLKFYDNSDLHHAWKDQYESLMEKKTIFDYE